MALLDSYVYELDLEWKGRRAGLLTGNGVPPLEISAPPEFGGEGGKWTPEHLLVAASATCLMSTFLVIAELSRFTAVSYAMKAHAKLEKVPGEGYRFTEIVHSPEIVVNPADLEKAQKALAKAEKGCFVNNSLKTRVRVEPLFRTRADAHDEQVVKV